MHESFEDEICTTEYVPQLKLKSLYWASFEIYLSGLSQ